MEIETKRLENDGKPLKIKIKEEEEDNNGKRKSIKAKKTHHTTST